MKTCTKCKEERELSSFHNSARTGDGKGTLCLNCSKEIKLKQRFGITQKQYDKVLKDQNGLCGVCGRDHDYIVKGRSFAVDHCHETGAIRGLLCTSCNQAIGKLGDTTEAIKSAVEYLTSKGTGLVVPDGCGR